MGFLNHQEYLKASISVDIGFSGIGVVFPDQLGGPVGIDRINGLRNLQRSDPRKNGPRKNLSI